MWHKNVVLSWLAERKEARVKLRGSRRPISKANRKPAPWNRTEAGQKKEAAVASGPSLGRKRPRRAKQQSLAAMQHWHRGRPVARANDAFVIKNIAFALTVAQWLRPFGPPSPFRLLMPGMRSPEESNRKKQKTRHSKSAVRVHVSVTRSTGVHRPPLLAVDSLSRLDPARNSAAPKTPGGRADPPPRLRAHEHTGQPSRPDDRRRITV